MTSASKVRAYASSTSEAPEIRGGEEGLLVEIRVSPSAPATAIRGIYGDRLKVAVNAPPEDNKANQELVEALSKWLGVRRDSVRIQAGHGSRDKVVAFAGMEEAELRERLRVLLGRVSQRES